MLEVDVWRKKTVNTYAYIKATYMPVLLPPRHFCWDEFRKKKALKWKGEQNQMGAHQHPHFTHLFSCDLSKSLPARSIFGVSWWKGGNPLRTLENRLPCACSHTHIHLNASFGSGLGEKSAPEY